MRSRGWGLRIQRNLGGGPCGTVHVRGLPPRPERDSTCLRPPRAPVLVCRYPTHRQQHLPSSFLPRFFFFCSSAARASAAGSAPCTGEATVCHGPCTTPTLHISACKPKTIGAPLPRSTRTEAMGRYHESGRGLKTAGGPRLEISIATTYSKSQPSAASFQRPRALALLFTTSKHAIHTVMSSPKRMPYTATLPWPPQCVPSLPFKTPTLRAPH